jgi:hypothetical protein
MLEQVPGSAFEQAKIWRETVDQEAFAKLEVQIITGVATEEEHVEYERLLAAHPGHDRLQAELVPALRAARAEFRQTLQ